MICLCGYTYIYIYLHIYIYIHTLCIYDGCQKCTPRLSCQLSLTLWALGAQTAQRRSYSYTSSPKVGTTYTPGARGFVPYLHVVCWAEALDSHSKAEDSIADRRSPPYIRLEATSYQPKTIEIHYLTLDG